MASQQQKLIRAVIIGAIGSGAAVVVGLATIGVQVAAAAYGVAIEPVHGIPVYAVAGGAVGLIPLLYALPTIVAAGFRALRDAGFLALLPWTRKE